MIAALLTLLWCLAPFGHRKKFSDEKLRISLVDRPFPFKNYEKSLETKWFQGIFGAAGGIRTLVRLLAN